MGVGVGRAGDSQEGIASEQSVAWAQWLGRESCAEPQSLRPRLDLLRARLVHGMVEGEGACREACWEMRGKRGWKGEAGGVEGLCVGS